MKAPCLLLISFCTVGFIRNINGERILGIFPLHMPSHFVMFQRILIDLVDKGHRVDVVSTFPVKKPRANYTDIINLSGKGMVMTNNLSLESVESMGSRRIEWRAKTYGNEACYLLGTPELQMLIKNPPEDPPYDLVITEIFFANCYLAFGRHLKIPVVGVTSALMPYYANEPLGNPVNTVFLSEHNVESTSYMNFWKRLKNTMIALWERHLVHRTTEAQTDIVRKYFGPKIPKIRELERDLSLLLVNSHHTLNGIQPNTPAVVEVGGLHVSDGKTELPKDLKKWLDNSEHGFIYFSFGSLLKIESFPNKTLAEVSTAFHKISPIRVLLKAANPNVFPFGLPENVVVLEWIEQVEVLKHKNIKGFVTHGGLMSIQEAITFGVPLIGVPIFADQPQNVKNCVDKRIAVFLDYKDLTADKIVDAVNAVVYDPKYKNNMIAFSKQFLDRPMTARKTAVFWIEYILKHGGDSLRSSAIKLSWWQLASLDIYCSILFVGLVMLHIFKLLLSGLSRRIMVKYPNLTSSKKFI